MIGVFRAGQRACCAHRARLQRHQSVAFDTVDVMAKELTHRPRGRRVAGLVLATFLGHRDHKIDEYKLHHILSCVSETGAT